MASYYHRFPNYSPIRATGVSALPHFFDNMWVWHGNILKQCKNSPNGSAPKQGPVNTCRRYGGESR